MSGIVEKIAEIEAEMARTQKNKATAGHLGMLKAKLAKLRRELITPKSQGGGTSDGKRNKEQHSEITRGFHQLLSIHLFLNRLRSGENRRRENRLHRISIGWQIDVTKQPGRGLFRSGRLRVHGNV